MVVENRRRRTVVYLCEFCGFGYRHLEIAEQCEEHCSKHGFVSVQISKKAVYMPRNQLLSYART